MMITNPALEAIPLNHEDGRWQVSLRPYSDTGLGSGTLDIGPAAAIPGATATVGGDWATVKMSTLPFDSYIAPAGHRSCGWPASRVA